MTTTPGNGAAALATSVPTPVTVPRSPVPMGTDTPTDGHVPGNGTAGNGHVPVPGGGPKRRFSSFLGPAPTGNGNGNGTEERAHVPVPAVPPVSDKVSAEPVNEAPADVEEKDDEGRDWTLFAMWSVIIVMNAMALLLASSGQIDGTWKWAGLSGADLRKWLLPGVTELGYIGFLMLGRYALRRGQSPFLWWGFAVATAGTAIFMNAVHGEAGHKFAQGLIFGVASAVSLAMTFAKFLIDYRAHRQDKGHTTGLRPKAWTFKALRSYPRLAFRADLIIARCERVTTRERAYELAETWRWVFEDAREGKENRKTASRTAWMTVYRELGMKVIEPQNIKLAKVTFAAPPPPQPVEPPPAAPKRSATPPPSNPVAGSPAAPTGSGAGAPPPPPKPDVVKPVPDAWWTDHKDHIAAVKAGIPTWDTQEKAPTVNDVQKIVANRTNAANTAACIRVLRSQRFAGSN